MLTRRPVAAFAAIVSSAAIGGPEIQEAFPSGSDPGSTEPNIVSREPSRLVGLAGLNNFAVISSKEPASSPSESGCSLSNPNAVQTTQDEVDYFIPEANRHWAYLGEPPLTNDDIEAVPENQMPCVLFPAYGKSVYAAGYHSVSTGKITVANIYHGAALCIIVKHEDGHKKGLGHSDQSGNIMYPSMVAEDPGCTIAVGNLNSASTQTNSLVFQATPAVNPEPLFTQPRPNNIDSKRHNVVELAALALKYIPENRVLTKQGYSPVCEKYIFDKTKLSALCRYAKGAKQEKLVLIRFKDFETENGVPNFNAEMRRSHQVRRSALELGEIALKYIPTSRVLIKKGYEHNCEARYTKPKPTVICTLRKPSSKQQPVYNIIVIKDRTEQNGRPFFKYSTIKSSSPTKAK